MKREDRLKETRRKLIDGTIQVIARQGLDGASTKLIGTTTELNEVYIYRSFKDKEDLFAKTFAFLDEELLDLAMKHADVMYKQEMEFELRCRVYFTAIWRFLLGNRDKCLTYVRYYYSPYFTRYSIEEHLERFSPLILKAQEVFKGEAEVRLILNHILNVMLDFAVKVYTGQMPDDEDHSEHVFRVVYRSIEQYFKVR